MNTNSAHTGSALARFYQPVVNHSGAGKVFFQLVFAVGVFIGLYLLKESSYLLFHSLAELFSIVVAAGIFMFTWNSRALWDNSYLMVVGIAYLFVGSLDLLHLLTYEGMGVFPGETLNHSIQLWVAARGMESVSLLVPFAFMNRHMPRPHLVFAGYFAVTTLVIVSILGWHVFPECYHAGTGLTPFKIGSEYVFVGLLAAAAAILVRRRGEFAPAVFGLLLGAIAITMSAEIIFTLWSDPYDIFSALGHFLKIVSFYLIYRAIIVTGIEEPFNIVFHNLKKSEREKAVLVTELREALDEVKTLSGFIPICSSCKKIRDDEGYWQQVEEYISRRSDAEFSHGLCPDCIAKYFPEYSGAGEDDVSGAIDDIGQA